MIRVWETDAAQVLPDLNRRGLCAPGWAPVLTLAWDNG